jgi:hypothetical protein
MSKLLYFLSTFVDSGLSIVGIRSPYEQPRYEVVQTIAPDVEIRDYAPRTVVETNVTSDDPGQAFGRLFRYITGANSTGAKLPGSTTVERSKLIAMTVPVEMTSGAEIMRFYLPPSVVAGGAPQPTEAGVRIETLPAETLGVIRYSGISTEARRDAQTAKLREALVKAGRTPEGAPVYFSYDPPFAFPFVRRNEVALPLAGK